MRKQFLILLCAGVIGLQVGCAAVPANSPYLGDDQRARISTLTISTAQTLPGIDLSDVEDSPVLRTAVTAAGFFSLAVCLMPTPVTLSVCASAIVPAAGAATTVEGAESVFKEIPKTIESARSTMEANLKRADIQEILGNKVSYYAKSHIGENAVIPATSSRAHIQNGSTSKADAILEVGLRRIKFRKSGSIHDPDFTLEITAQSKLKEAANDTVVLEAEYRYLSDARTAETWLRDINRPISLVLAEGIDSLAQHITDEAVLLSKSSLSALKGERPSNFPYSLAPLYPPVPEVGYGFGQMTLSDTPRRFVQIESLQPTLRWEMARSPQPEKTNRPAVLYDLRVFQAREGRTFSCDPIYPCRFATGWFPGDLIIKLENLTETSYAINIPLKNCTKYFWTVRAKWESSGRLTATEWMATYKFLLRNDEPWKLRRNPERAFDGGIRHALASSFLPFETPCEKPQAKYRSEDFSSG